MGRKFSGDQIAVCLRHVLRRIRPVPRRASRSQAPTTKKQAWILTGILAAAVAPWLVTRRAASQST